MEEDDRTHCSEDNWCGENDEGVGEVGEDVAEVARTVEETTMIPKTVVEFAFDCHIFFYSKKQ